MKNTITTPAYGAGVRAENVTSFSSGRDELDCVTYSLENFLYLEGRRQSQGDRTLETLFDYWCQQDGSVPSYFSPYENVKSARETISAVIDVRPQNPEEFILSHHKICSTTGRSDGWSGMPLGKIDAWADYARVKAMQYNICRRTGLPSFHEIRHDISGVKSHFVALLLPIANPLSGNTEQIFSCTRQLSKNETSGA